MKAGASGPEVSPGAGCSHGVAQAQASMRQGFPALSVLAFPPHRAHCGTTTTAVFSSLLFSGLSAPHLFPPPLSSPLLAFASVSLQWTVVAHATLHYTQLRQIPGTQHSRTLREPKRAILSPLASHPPLLLPLGRPNCQPLSGTSPHRKYPRATLRAAIRIKHSLPCEASKSPKWGHKQSPKRGHRR